MRKELIGAASALALMLSGTALAQSTQGATEQPGMTTAPAAPSATMGATGSPSTNTASAEEMLGKDVVGSDGKELGEVEDIILDPSTRQAKQVIISSGGFLGIGEKQIAIDASQLTARPDGDDLQLSGVTQDDIKNMPEFEYNDSMVSWNRSQKDSERATGTGATGAAPGMTGGGAGGSTNR